MVGVRMRIGIVVTDNYPSHVVDSARLECGPEYFMPYIWLLFFLASRQW